MSDALAAARRHHAKRQNLRTHRGHLRMFTLDLRMLVAIVSADITSPVDELELAASLCVQRRVQSCRCTGRGTVLGSV